MFSTDSHSQANLKDPELFRLIADLSPSGTLAVDATGAILFANYEAERLFGYDRGELAGHSIDDLLPQRFRPRHPHLRQEFFSRPSARPMGGGRELFGLRRDGTEVPVEIGLSPVETERGPLILASVVDVTARREAQRAARESERRLEEQLRQSQKLEAVGTLAGGIAHDFNNLLRAVVGYAELAHRAVASLPAVRADLDQVLAAAERGRQLVQRLLTFSRRREAARVRLDLGHPIQETLKLLRSSIPATVEMQSHLDPETPHVLADEIEIHQILMNLVTNAAHAMRERGGRLEVRLAPEVVDEAFAAAHRPLRPGAHARMSVSDTGEGMPQEVIERVFEPFFTTKPPGEGTGLGLAVLHGIVTNYEGAIEVQSRVSEGTTFHIWLPAAANAPLGAAASASLAELGQRILLVDDEEILAELTRRQLIEEGYRVTMHFSSEAALADFRTRPEAFDLMITDNTMPRLSGLALTQEVRAIRPELPVLMVSGLRDILEVEELRAHGIRGVLGKPHTGAELLQAVRSALVTD